MNWDIYPRPQLRRESWQSLNGTWMMNGREVLVPACLDEEEMLYQKSFSFKRENECVILHFGAADQIAEVTLNGKFLGRHEGGYLPFSFDITDIVCDGINELSVKIEDRLSHDYPYGKQRKDRGGMWYTPMSGLWQSVWLEQLPKEHIKGIKITPSLSAVDIDLDGPDCDVVLSNGQYARLVGGHLHLEIENPVLWDPDDPHLYKIAFVAGEDRVSSYFALRTIEIKEINGINRVCLNGKPVFLHGVLDQGYFNPGLMLPEDPCEYEKDALRLKSLGFNLIRKHIKIEPEIFYYECDKLGMLVMQDMVNSGDYNFFRDTVLGTIGARLSDRSGIDGKRKQFWAEHSKKTVEQLYNHPCVVAYTIFNEGWGQFESDAMYDMLKGLDSTRLYDSTSGWFAQSKSDFDSLHIYFRTKTLRPKIRPMIVSECGGYSLDLGMGQEKSYGYGKCRSKRELTERIVAMYERMIIPAIEKGCCGCIYTQLSDIEDEINGLYSYDRSVCKVNEGILRTLSERIKSQIQ